MGRARAIGRGWHDHWPPQDDPCRYSLETDRCYRALMATAQADISRQRAEFVRIDATLNRG